MDTATKSSRLAGNNPWAKSSASDRESEDGRACVGSKPDTLDFSESLTAGMHIAGRSTSDDAMDSFSEFHNLQFIGDCPVVLYCTRDYKPGGLRSNAKESFENIQAAIPSGKLTDFFDFVNNIINKPDLSYHLLTVEDCQPLARLHYCLSFYKYHVEPLCEDENVPKELKMLNKEIEECLTLREQRRLCGVISKEMVSYCMGPFPYGAYLNSFVEYDRIDECILFNRKTYEEFKKSVKEKDDFIKFLGNVIFDGCSDKEKIETLRTAYGNGRENLSFTEVLGRLKDLRGPLFYEAKQNFVGMQKMLAE